MHIQFHVVRYKNFLASGNAMTTIELDKHHKTVITGKNGNGKSTMLDAVCFALYGRPLRNIVKGGLVNSINQKALMTEIEFTTQNNRYLVKRGIKPAVFEIFCNGSQVQQLPSVIEMQDYLEKYVLKCNFKTFTQVVILGSTSYVPFMRLAPAARREVLEDILDIQVFSTMSILLRDKISDLKDTISKAQTNYAIIESQHNMAADYAAKWQKTQEEKRQDCERKIEANNEQISLLRTKLSTLQLEWDAFKNATSNSTSIQEQISKTHKLEAKFKAQLSHFKTNHRFFEDNGQCPTCTQAIPEDFKAVKIQTFVEQIAKTEQKIAELGDIGLGLKKRFDAAKAAEEAVTKIASEIHVGKYKITDLENSNNSLRVAMAETKQPAPSITVGNLEQAKNEFNELITRRNIYDHAKLLLQDTGIRTKIVTHYLPVINTTVNTYLSELDFPIQFVLDEQFKETIKSRGRDEFAYENFSEGEKKRIDVSLLLAFCKVAQLKNTVSCNLLIFDEIFDSSLDANGIDDMMAVLDALVGKNIMVISHRDIMTDKFDCVLSIGKEKGFSVMKVVR